MSMHDPEMQDVERFYARQRREILERVAPSRHGAGRRLSWMAAAAVLALTALGLVLLPPLEPQMEMNTDYLIAEELILPLPAFGTWSEEQMLDGDDSDMGSIEWLLVDLLTSFGNMAGRSSHFIAEGARHYPNLNVVLVGATSKGRQGSHRVQRARGPLFHHRR